MHLERADGRDDHREFRAQACLATLDVEELLAAEIGAEAGFRDHVVAQLEGELGRHHRVAAVGDVAERPAMDERRVVLERLHEVGHHGVLQEDGHGAGRLQLLGAHQLTIAGLADQHPAEPALEVAEIGGQAEHRHDLGGDRDVEAVLARKAVRDPAQAADDRAQRAVVHVDHAPPEDAPLIEAELVAPVDVIVDQRGEQVVRRADGVEIAGEMEVDVLHRHHLGIAAAGGAALHAEARPERRLARAADRLLADPVEAVAQAHRRRGLALAGGRRGDRGDQDQASVGPVGDLLDEIEADLGDVLAVRLDAHLSDTPSLAAISPIGSMVASRAISMSLLAMW